MLIRIRNHCMCTIAKCSSNRFSHMVPVIPADYSGQLTCLLRYPPAPEPDPIAIADTHPTSLLLRQAIALQLSPSPLAGVSVMTENRNIFNIPLEVPEPLPPPIRKQGRPRGGVPQPGITGSLRGGHSRQLSAQALGLPDIARGLLDRGESLGINKSSIFNAVSDFRVCCSRKKKTFKQALTGSI
jgi:TBC1 domain family member 5